MQLNITKPCMTKLLYNEWFLGTPDTVVPGPTDLPTTKPPHNERIFLVIPLGCLALYICIGYGYGTPKCIYLFVKKQFI